jgi:NAD(P) transhydrogenase subunit alpha
VKQLVSRGLEVYVEAGAGENAFISDRDYESAGAVIAKNPREAWSSANAAASEHSR